MEDRDKKARDWKMRGAGSFKAGPARGAGCVRAETDAAWARGGQVWMWMPHAHTHNLRAQAWTASFVLCGARDGWSSWAQVEPAARLVGRKAVGENAMPPDGNADGSPRWRTDSWPLRPQRGREGHVVEPSMSRGWPAAPCAAEERVLCLGWPRRGAEVAASIATSNSRVLLPQAASAGAVGSKGRAAAASRSAPRGPRASRRRPWPDAAL